MTFHPHVWSLAKLASHYKMTVPELSRNALHVQIPFYAFVEHYGTKIGSLERLNEWVEIDSEIIHAMAFTNTLRQTLPLSKFKRLSGDIVIGGDFVRGPSWDQVFFASADVSRLHDALVEMWPGTQPTHSEESRVTSSNEPQETRLEVLKKIGDAEARILKAFTGFWKDRTTYQKAALRKHDGTLNISAISRALCESVNGPYFGSKEDLPDLKRIRNVLSALRKKGLLAD